MADTTISALTAALAAKMAGTAVTVLDDTDTVTKKTTLATLRTVMFAGSTGYTATDPLVCGAISTSGDFAVASTKFTVAAASGNTAVAGTLAVTGTSTLTGVVGIGGAGVAGSGIIIRNTALAAASEYGMNAQPTFTSTATTRGVVVDVTAQTDAASFTQTSTYGVRINAPVLGAASAITTMYGVYADNQGKSGVTNAYGVYIAAQSGAATTNIGLYNGGTTSLNRNIGIGTAPVFYTAIRMAGALTTASGAVSYGLELLPTLDAAATTAGAVLSAQLKTVAAAFTMVSGYGIRIETPSLGASSAITTNRGLYIPNQGASGITNAYGVYIDAVSGAATTNIGLYNAGTSHLIGNLGVGEASTTTSLLHLKKSSIPTSAAGLAAGDVWNNGGVLTIV